MPSAASLLSKFIVYFHRLPRQSWEQLLESPQIHVERLAAAVVALQLLQFILYHARLGETSHSSVRWGAWAAFYLPVPLAAVAVAVMLRFPCPYWLVAVFFAAGQADTMAAYSLRDGDTQSVRRVAKRVLSFAYPALALALFVVHGGATSGNTLGRTKEIVSLALGFLIILQDLKISGRAMKTPRSEICKVAADHVRFFPAPRRPRSPYADYDDDWVQHRRSVVAVGSLDSYQSAMSGCTTLEDILEIPDSGCSSRMQDACVSSALFLQLLQRCGNEFDRPQVLERSSANHAFRDVLAEPRGWDRAFRLVEVQLSLMRGYFFSAHGSPSRTSYRLYTVYSLLKISFLLTVRSLAMDGITSAGLLLLYALVSLEACQLVGYLMSNRFVVAYMCDRRRDLSGTVDAAAAGVRDNIFVALPLLILEDVVGIKWEVVNLGQYSLVEDFDRVCLTRRLMARLLPVLGVGRQQQQQQQQPPRDFFSSVIKPTKYSSLEFDGLKRWICDKAADPEAGSRFAFEAHFTWSSDSLRLLSWTLDKESKIHTILIWHVATWFCDMSLLHRPRASSSSSRGVSEEYIKHVVMEKLLFPAEYTFARMLSSYCAYLVAFRPELLHEHPALTASIFDEAVKGAKRLFGKGVASPGERYAMTKTWRFWDWLELERLGYGGIVKQGITLGQDLMDHHGSSERWEILADFWGEMMLFVARSGNAAAHVEHLARGGGGDELVTQLWALLSNGWDRTFIRRSSKYESLHSCCIL